MIKRIHTCLGWLSVLVVVLVIGVSGQVAHAQTPVALELVLSLDTSESVSSAEYALQVKGLVAAFNNYRVIQAIEKVGGGGIAVAVTQWAGPDQQELSLNWHHITGEEDARAYAQTLASLARPYEDGGTAIASALKHAAAQFEGNGFVSKRRVIDLSGDGRENRKGHVVETRDALVASGIIINGLPIVNEDNFLYYYFKNTVIGGPNAFAELAYDYEDFTNAIIEKLVREIGAPALSLAPDRLKHFASIHKDIHPASIPSRRKAAGLCPNSRLKARPKAISDSYPTRCEMAAVLSPSATTSSRASSIRHRVR